MAIQTDTQPEAQGYRGDYRGAQSVYAPEYPTSALVGRVSWGAVTAGAALALAVQLVLNLFGMGVGLAAADPGAAALAAASEVSWGTLIWMAVTGVIAAFAGGFCSGRLAGERRMAMAGWHGLVSWAASTLVIAVLAATVAGVLVGGNMRMMTMEIGAPAAAAPAVPDAAAPDAAVAPPAVDASAVAAVDESALARASLFCAVALLLGACAGWLGGRAGAVDPDDLEREFSRAVH